ncbi:MAG: TIGR00159 family protein [Desulfobacteraceae bacterium]|jgi:uncharacterized protein (TIGR00159 family)|nr:MAG: TIGR00159 family protein [Desulfobacteraceae bacterium]
MDFLAIVTTLRIRDLADILLLGILVYHLYLWFRGTKAFKALIGMVAMGVVFTIARTWGLFLTTWVFQILWQVLVILLIILFQSEIRQVLERVNPMRVLGFRRPNSSVDWAGDLSDAIFKLASRRIGALVILERSDRVNEWITAGQSIEADAGLEILMSIFQKDSPLHDGAILVREGRLKKAACYLPLSSAEGLPKEWGTRHRAALGLSERCDAWVIAVSEERGTVSIARGGAMTGVKGKEPLASLISEGILPKAQSQRSWGERVKSYFTINWAAKLLAISVVSATWLLLAGQQDFEVSFYVPPVLRNVPADKEIAEPVNPRVNLTVRGLRRDASTLRSSDVRVEIDLSLAHLGYTVFPVSRDQVFLPNDRIQIVQIRPTQMEFKLRNKQ